MLSSLLAPRSPARCGKATLAMLVSSTSMNAASATTTAISQGLNFGVQISGASAIESPTADKPWDPPTCRGAGGDRHLPPVEVDTTGCAAPPSRNYRSRSPGAAG